MKKAGVRFSEDIYLSFEYDESSKKVDLVVIDNNTRLTGSVKVTDAAKTTKTTKTSKKNN